ncbi:STE domain-containing protein KNAG_0C05340 [Huiozyma naganishii CBS 8797]|uniref:Uncharacterized protein n=1 Tax=Huiozyma naganishii (strain ATCC MYA-139 / BCRC 22969 / CBS 8797 / KCTC 17520 / NBRC 10181 / NCYC 3082 / Yp74L-3) TaxID=1071383 RepID=J7RX56_HUIN7|nr:hypothetical protein KNAG_0C05340 [Kazachstania naganishii CBS 8797]CCK69632.1 hypothetical protein KNAG_0C05340 [Kazachstania naganishii CBS 8797]
MDSMNNRMETILKEDYNDSHESLQRSTPEEVEESLRLIDDLKYFLSSAPANWQENQIIRRYYLNNEQGFVSCVFWNNVYYVTGTDIVKCCVYRMQKFGRAIIQKKKFEEGIFSDLRNLKCGIDATLEQPKSDFLAFLFRNSCLKTQKKQKVFFWFSVPYDKLFRDALERDLKRETLDQQSTTRALSEPALSFQYNIKLGTSLSEQLQKHIKQMRLPDELDAMDDEPELKEEPSILDCMKINVDDDVTESSVPLTPAFNSSAPTSIQILETEDVPILHDKTVLDIPPTASLNLDPYQSMVTPVKLGQSLSSDRVGLPELDKEVDDDAFPLDYFPIDIEYPDLMNSQMSNPNTNGVGLISTAEINESYQNPFLHIPKTKKSKAYPTSATSLVMPYMDSNINQSLPDSEELSNLSGLNMLPQQRIPYGYQQQLSYNPCINIMPSRHPGDIMAQTIEPRAANASTGTPIFPGCDAIYTPQEISDWKAFLQQQPSHMQIIQTPHSSNVINPYGSAYHSADPAMWGHSLYMGNGSTTPLHMEKTAQFIRRKQFRNMVPSSTFTRKGKVMKTPHIKKYDPSKEKRSKYQKKFRDNTKQSTTVDHDVKN